MSDRKIVAKGTFPAIAPKVPKQGNRTQLKEGRYHDLHWR